MDKILIIEDDLIDQMTLARMFEQQLQSYKYAMVKSIKNAKIELQNQKYDLVISDHNLGDGTAFDLLHDLKGTPFILITGNENEAIVNSVIDNSGAIASFTKDLNSNYITELCHLIQKICAGQIAFPKSDSTLKTNNNSNQLMIQSGKITIDLSNVYKIFDNKKEDIKGTIEIFIHHKPREMDELYHFLNDENCDAVSKTTHRIKSGFRLLGMKDQIDLIDFIEKNVGTSEFKCNCDKVFPAFKQLSSDTKIAIELLKKELPILFA